MKIFKSLAIITAVVAIAGGGTYALWTDSATITGSTFSAGTMDLKVDANPASGVQQWEDTFSVPAEYFVKDLYPGYPTNPGLASQGKEQNWQIIDIKNAGTTDGKVNIRLQRTSGWNELAGNLTFTVYYAANNVDFVATGISGTLDQFTDSYLLGNLKAGNIASVKIEWTLPSSAGNNVQSDSVTLDAVFDLVQ